MNKKAANKYKSFIEKAREEKRHKNANPDNQKDGSPENEEKVNLSIKVPRSQRQHWVAEAKRSGTTLTAVIISALNERFGKP